MIEDGVKISELTEVSSVAGTDIIPIVNNDETKSATISQVAQYTYSTRPPEYCVASTSSSPSISSNFFVPLNYIYGKSGNFTLEDGGIKIGANINVVKVSGNCFIDSAPTSPGYVWGKIYLIRGNQESIIATSINSVGNCAYMSTPIPTALIGVQEGDIIKLMADGGSGGVIRGYSSNTWLLVEKIA